MRRKLVGLRRRCAVFCRLATFPDERNAAFDQLNRIARINRCDNLSQLFRSADEMRATHDHDLPHPRRNDCLRSLPADHPGHRPRCPRCPVLAPDLGTGSDGQPLTAYSTPSPCGCRRLIPSAETPPGPRLSGCGPDSFGCRTAAPYQWQASNASSTSSRSLPISRPRRATARPTRYFTELKCRLSSSAATL